MAALAHPVFRYRSVPRERLHGLSQTRSWERRAKPGARARPRQPGFLGVQGDSPGGESPVAVAVRVLQPDQHSPFCQPDGNMSDGSFGSITQTIATRGIFQFAAKLGW